MSDVDLKEASRLITGTEMDPTRHIRLLDIAQRLAIRPDDPVFAVLVALEGYSETFTGMPDRLAKAASAAAQDVATAARAQAECVIAETVASAVDRQVLTRQFRRWAFGSVLAATLVMAAAAGAAIVTLDHLSSRAEARVDDATKAAEKRVNDMKIMLVDTAVAAAVQASQAAAQQAADATLTGLQGRLDTQMNAEVVAKLRVGQSHADEVRALLNAEDAAPGTLQRLKQAVAQGWLPLVNANRLGSCPTRQSDQSTGRQVCILWAPN